MHLPLGSVSDQERERIGRALLEGERRIATGERHRKLASALLLKRPVTFHDATTKARWLDAAASLDTRLPSVRAVAKRIAQGVTGQSWDALARAAHRFVRDGIRYRPDPGHHEQFADSGVVLARGYDDCDGKSRLFVALCRVLGIESRILPVFNGPESFVHVQAEVRYAGSERAPGAEPGGWVRAELILAGCELGQDPETVPRDTSGRRPLA